MHIASVLFAVFFAQAQLAWVNPSRCLNPCGYQPPALVRVNDNAVPDTKGKHLVGAEAASKLHDMLTRARESGCLVTIRSAYRSYSDQAFVYRKIKEQGRAARPGHSEHQLGTSVDLVLSSAASIAWVSQHAHEYGFVVSYPLHKEHVTGYRAEPWHVRYVGSEIAAEIKGAGCTLEEYFRLHPQLGVSGDCSDCPLRLSIAACGQITAAGVCRGKVLSWCYDGALVSVDCSLSGERCGRVGSGYGCI